jgi:hypothetical protein
VVGLLHVSATLTGGTTLLAGKTFLSERGVEKHMSNVYSKLAISREAAHHQRVLAVRAYLTSRHPVSTERSDRLLATSRPTCSAAAIQLSPPPAPHRGTSQERTAVSGS